MEPFLSNRDALLSLVETTLLIPASNVMTGIKHQEMDAAILARKNQGTHVFEQQMYRCAQNYAEMKTKTTAKHVTLVI